MDHGITFFDTADSYGAGWSERWVGRALGKRRGEATIATKCGQPPTVASKLLDRGRRTEGWPFRARGQADKRFRPDYIESALLRSLRRLDTDYVDVLMLHSPPASVLSDGSWFNAMSDLRDRGLIRFLGVSARSLEDAALAIREYNIDYVEVELNPCTAPSAGPVLALGRARGTSVVARQVFGSGGLLNAVVVALGSQDIGRTRTEVAAALRQFALQIPDVSVVLIGMSTVDHVVQNTSPWIPPDELVSQVAEAARQVCA